MTKFHNTYIGNWINSKLFIFMMVYFLAKSNLFCISLCKDSDVRSLSYLLVWNYHQPSEKICNPMKNIGRKEGPIRIQKENSYHCLKSGTWMEIVEAQGEIYEYDPCNEVIPMTWRYTTNRRYSEETKIQFGKSLGEDTWRLCIGLL